MAEMRKPIQINEQNENGCAHILKFSAIETLFLDANILKKCHVTTVMHKVDIVDYDQHNSNFDEGRKIVVYINF